LPVAIESFLSQDWPDKELVVVDDGRTPARDLVEQVSGAIYIRLEKKLLLGAKRNLCCEVATGQVIAHLDDDDWSAPDRITDQVGLLTRFERALVGYSSVFVWDVVARKSFLYGIGTLDTFGTSQCYRREWWEKHPFLNLRVNEDLAFTNTARDCGEVVAAVQHPAKIVIRVHRSQTIKYGPDGYRPVPRQSLPSGFFDAIGEPENQDQGENGKCEN
jgi:glycosyltransferase involved in cell wall biosynthesis